jgi:hypothetical protein
MKDKKHKHLQDLLDEYLELHDEQIELPLLKEKIQKKFGQHSSNNDGMIYKQSEAEDLYKGFSSLKKYEDRENEIKQQLTEVEESLKGFLGYLNGGKVSYERKVDNDKSKQTYLFWLEDGTVKCNR